jgi:hypothetical protein
LNVDIYCGAFIVLWSATNLSPILWAQARSGAGRSPGSDEQLSPESSAASPIPDGGEGAAEVVVDPVRIGITVLPTQ